MKPVVITFAGVVGTSKTPIAHYLSCGLDLPILSNDSIRTEVKEDLGTVSEEEYSRRRDERVNALTKEGRSFIYDASIDRRYAELEKQKEKYNFDIFIISLDLSKSFILELYKRKNYDRVDRVDELMRDHQNFLENYRSRVSLSITDETFPKRLELSLYSVKAYLQH
jgi:hypothetical protein